MASDNTPFKTEGTCGMCGEKGPVTCIGEDSYYCEECLESAFTQCDVCGQYYSDTVEFEAVDGKHVCEFCVEEIEG